MSLEDWKGYLLRCGVTSDLWELMGLLDIHPSWYPVLRNEVPKPYFLELCKFIAKERSKTCPIYPAPQKTFAWTLGCPPNRVKVVIVGQDPYYKPGHANGLVFSALPGVGIPYSLSKLYSNLKKDESIDFTPPQHSNLFGWAEQGVLLLNTVLTVRQFEPNSHSFKTKGVSVHWDYLTTSVIDYIAYHNTGVVFILLGKQAWDLIPLIGLRNPLVTSLWEQTVKFRHRILYSYHPAYPSCRCPYKPKIHTPDCLNFSRRHPFSDANAFLKSHHGPQAVIDWNELDLSAGV